MKTLPPDLDAHLLGGVTTLARCWRVGRADGVTLGFTDHDRDLVFDGISHRAATGIAPGAVEATLGLAVDNLEVMGALQGEGLTADDLRAGRYDQARATLYLVNWQDTDQRVVLCAGHIGEVRRQGHAFTAELRGLAHLLNQPMGRVFARDCDAMLGDGRCGVDLDDLALTAMGEVAAVEGAAAFTATGLEGFAAGWFARGRLEWTSGANEGAAAEVRLHHAGPSVKITLRAAPGHAIAPGDGFTVSAGCDKRFATCRGKFQNTDNFRGFPHMPGNDWVISYPRRGQTHDGGSMTGGGGGTGSQHAQ
jgi:uncharacterized phage protein (TIGR02218 family)